VSGRVVGRDVPRVEDPALLRGRARFVDDVRPQGCLHAAVLRSPHAHAAIRSIDAAAARALPGVVAVYTAADLAPHLAEPRLRVALPSPAFRQVLDRPVLASDEVVHVGEAIALVIAEDRYVAEDALPLIEIDYDPLPAVAECVAALDPSSPTAHRGAPHNLVAEFSLAYGDAGAAFASAAHVVRERLFQHRGGGHSMEGRGVVAVPDPLEDRLTVWSSTQTPHAGRALLATILGMPEESIRVVVPEVGGGFGPKLVFYPEEAAVALAARLLARPVKWIEDRREHFVATTQERDQVWDVELAVDGEGRILGVRGEMIHDHGAWTARGINIAYGALSAMPLAYVVPAYSMRCRSAVTNKVPVTPVRGAGQPQGVFAMERLLDRAATAVGLDRAEIRRRNLVPGSAMPYTTPLKTRGGMQVVLDSGDYPRCMAEALRRAGWDGFAARQAAARAEGRCLGIGVANYVEGTGRGPFEHVALRIGTDGRVRVATGAAPMGQSTRTMLAQVVAEQLGGDMGIVDVIAGDTAAAPAGLGGFNSRQAVLAGSAAHASAIALRRRLLEVAASLLEVSEDDLDIDGGAVRVKGAEGLGVTFAQAARAVAGLPGYALPGGKPGLAASEDVVIDPMTYANGTCVAEVEVDPGTGDTRLQRITFVHDCGRALHPRIVDGQVLGGIAHGIGNALFEWMGFDEDAQPVTTTLAEYLLVTATEMPAVVELAHLEHPTPLNPLGIKGVGESGVIPTAAAIASAVEDALSGFGVRISRVPIRPQDLVAQIAPEAVA
jgi:carbon-monoxide dehydrogenase large subunit